jgi:hypothetical protein
VHKGLDQGLHNGLFKEYPQKKNILPVGFPAIGGPERRADLASKQIPEIILDSKCFLEEFITKRRVNACLFLDGNF